MYIYILSVTGAICSANNEVRQPIADVLPALTSSEQHIINSSCVGSTSCKSQNRMIISDIYYSNNLLYSYYTNIIERNNIWCLQFTFGQQVARIVQLREEFHVQYLSFIKKSIMTVALPWTMVAFPGVTQS